MVARDAGSCGCHRTGCPIGLWSLPTDDFLGDVFDDLGAEWLATLGCEYDASDLYRLGKRVWTLVRLFNVREGFDRGDKSLPTIFREPLPGARDRGSAIDPNGFQRVLDRYYAARGWGPNGRLLTATLKRLGLADIVDGETPLGDPPTDGPGMESTGRGEID